MNFHSEIRESLYCERMGWGNSEYVKGWGLVGVHKRTREERRESSHVPVCLQGKQLAGAQRVSKMFACVYLPVYVRLVVCGKGVVFPVWLPSLWICMHKCRWK